MQLVRFAGVCTAERPADPRERVERIVHEAMLTWRVVRAAERRSSRRMFAVGSAWPPYAHERGDWGALPADGEVLDVPVPWRPTARQITEAERVVLEWYDGRNVRDWEWLLLELRAWQAIFRRRGGWRAIETSFAVRPNIPSYSRTYLAEKHRELISMACVRAFALGHV